MNQILCAVRQMAWVGALMLTFGWMNATHGVTIDWKTIDQPSNRPDEGTGLGSVADTYQIMTYEFTNSQYVEFLNAIDPQGTNPNSVYNPLMESDPRGGIAFSGGAWPNDHYSVKLHMGNKPVNYVSWWDAARVANWLHNGAQLYESSDDTGSAPQNTGAYPVGTATSGLAPAKKEADDPFSEEGRAKYWVPTENEWFKAAYHEPKGMGDYYWTYATAQGVIPESVSAVDDQGVENRGDGVPKGNSANIDNGAVWNWQEGNVTTVGTNGDASAWLTFDQEGNVAEWNDLDGLANMLRGVRGEGWDDDDIHGKTVYSLEYDPSFESDDVGFRLARLGIAVPEPSTWVMGLAGLACGGWHVFRRRRKTQRRSVP